jgi:adenine-specific DNA-methyltransferase
MEKNNKEDKNLSNNTQTSETEFKDITENGGIGLHFTGKANSLRIVRKVKPRILKEIPELSLGNEKQKSKNLIIEGDNLMSMSTLYQCHSKIDLIITDPPYNTGEDFRYNDR